MRSVAPMPITIAHVSIVRNLYCGSRALAVPSPTVLLQSGGGGALKLVVAGIINPVALVSQAPAKALLTITASGFGHPKAKTLPWPLRSACIASIPCSVR